MHEVREVVVNRACAVRQTTAATVAQQAAHHLIELYDLRHMPGIVRSLHQCVSHRPRVSVAPWAGAHHEDLALWVCCAAYRYLRSTEANTE